MLNVENIINDPVAIGTTLNRTSIQSSTYSPGTAGWILNADGSGEVNGDVVLTEGGTQVFIGPTPPVSPPNGTFWFDTSSGYPVMKVYNAGTSEFDLYQFGTPSIAAGTISANLLVAGIVVAGIVDATTISAAEFLSFSTDPLADYIAYTTAAPTLGNVFISLSNVTTTDSVGNTIPAGLYVGNASGSTPQVALVPSAGGPGNPALLVFPLSPTSFFGNQPNIGALSPSSSGQLFVSGPSLSQVGNRDWVQMGLLSDASGFYAKLHFTFVDDGQTHHDYMQLDCTGVNIYACNTLVGTVPGTVSGVTPTGSETWHNASLLNSWTAASPKIGGVGIRYRCIPWGVAGAVEIEGDVVGPGGVTGNSVCMTLPSGYVPPNDRNREAGWAAFPSSVDPPWIFIDHTTGNVQITGIQTAGQEIFWHVIVPLD
jgi:hypothetical protein